MTEITAQHAAAYLNGERELRDLIALDPSYIAQLRGRAQFFLEGGHHDRALIMLEMLEEIDRTDALPTLLAVEVLLKQGHSDRAEQKILRLLERHPNSAEARVAHAELLIQTGELVAAAAILEGVIAADPRGRTDAGRRAQGVAGRAYDLFESA